MSKSRPIARRPWRRPPWRKSSRPKRWISLNSGATHGASSVVVPQWFFTGSAAAGGFPAVTFASGQLDVEPWADNQEIVIDRIIGDLAVAGVTYGVIDPIPPVLYAPPVVYRMGILVQEEADATSAPAIDLFNDEHLEDYEWMWLMHSRPSNWNYLPANTEVSNAAGVGWNDTYHLDLRVKRKLGQTDQLLLYAQYANESAPEFPGGPVTFVTGSHLLRSVFVSK